MTRNSSGRTDAKRAHALLLIAVAGASRLRYPRATVNSDAIAFKQFVGDELATITGGAATDTLTFPQFRGQKNVPLQDVLYHDLRCTLIHEAIVPNNLGFTGPRIENGEKYETIELRPDGALALPEAWILNLAQAVSESPEARCDFEAEELKTLLKFPCYLIAVGLTSTTKSGHVQIHHDTKFAGYTVDGQLNIAVFTDQELVENCRKANGGSLGVIVVSSRDEFVRLLAPSRLSHFVFNPVAGQPCPKGYPIDSILVELMESNT